jgi:hypothetical protein
MLFITCARDTSAEENKQIRLIWFMISFPMPAYDQGALPPKGGGQCVQKTPPGGAAVEAFLKFFFEGF